MFYKRVAEWIKMKSVIIFPIIRLSEIACFDNNEQVFEYPSRAMMEKWNGVLYSLAGFEKQFKDSYCHFNFILSNGDRSTQRDEKYPFDHTHMIPADALKRLRSVTIHYFSDDWIRGFSFFDKDGALLWKIGATVWSG